MNVISEWLKKNVPTRRKNYPAGALIFSTGDSANIVYFIESGDVRITRKMPDIGSDISLGVLGPEELFGIIAFMTGKPRTADARAVTDCVLWEIDKETFREAVTKDPKFTRFVIKGMTRRLEDLHTKLKNTTELMTDFTRRMEDLSVVWHSLITWG
ncbi:MAG TPA: Crp/Fnr family transcriptional regulator [Candidatus Hypogeohydataceae bacterium YC41]